MNMNSTLTGAQEQKGKVTEIATDKNTQSLINELSQTGYRHIRNKQLNDAECCFKKILAVEPQNSYALVGLGDIFRKRKQFAAALEYYRSCLTLESTNSYALFGTAESLQGLNDYQSAIKYWQEYLTIDNTDSVVHTRLADAFRKEKNYNEALEHYNSALNIEPLNKYALVGLGWLYFRNREYSLALECWQKIIQNYEQHDIRLYTAIGNCYRKMRNFEVALSYFRQAFTMERENFYVIYGMADCYRELGSYDEAIYWITNLISRDSTNHVLLTRLGELYSNKGDCVHARQYYQEALTQNFDLFAALGLARLHKLEGNYDEALFSFNELMQYNQIADRVTMEIRDCSRLKKAQQRIDDSMASLQEAVS